MSLHNSFVWNFYTNLYRRLDFHKNFDVSYKFSLSVRVSGPSSDFYEASYVAVWQQFEIVRDTVMEAT